MVKPLHHGLTASAAHDVPTIASLGCRIMSPMAVEIVPREKLVLSFIFFCVTEVPVNPMILQLTDVVFVMPVVPIVIAVLVAVEPTPLEDFRWTLLRLNSSLVLPYRMYATREA